LSKTILFLETLPTISGGQAVLLSLVHELRKTYNISVLLPGEGPLAEMLQSSQVSCHFVSMGRYSLVRKTIWDVLNYLVRLPWLILFTRQLIKRQHVNLVYANSGPTFIWGTLAAAWADRPVIWHHHNLLEDAKTLTFLRIVGRLPTVRQIICVSEAARRQFPTLIHKIVVVATGVDAQRFHPAPALGAQIRQELNIPFKDKVVGIIGDLISLKGQNILLNAIPMSPSSVHYLVVGSVRLGDDESLNYAANLRQTAPDNVIFTGRREDIIAVLNALDLLVIASERETGPLVLLEALACGVPVISTPVGRAPELLLPEHLFPIGDVSALANRLRFWLADTQRLQTAGRAARSLAEKQLSLEQFCNCIQTEIERACLTEQ